MTIRLYRHVFRVVYVLITFVYIGGVGETAHAMRPVQEGLVREPVATIEPIEALNVANRWTITRPMPYLRREVSAVATSTHLYLIGGYNSASVPVAAVQVAEIQPDGSLGAWFDVAPLASGSYYVGATAVGNVLIAMNVTESRVYTSRALPDGRLEDWQAATSPPQPVSGGVLLAHGGYVYVLDTPNYNRTRVQYAQVAADGSLGAWIETIQTGFRGYAAAAFLDGFLYFVGGGGCGEELATVERAPVNPDGSLGSWTPASSLLRPGWGMAAVGHEGQLLAIGGQKCTELYTKNQVAPLDTSGSLLTWQAAEGMTTPRVRLSLAQSGTRLYAVGGESLGWLSSIEWLDLSKGISPPIDFGVSIDDGALFTNEISVTLSIRAPSTMATMMVSNDGGFAGAEWEPFAAEKAWTITQFGNSIIPRVVYVKFRAYDDTTSATVQDDIILDITPPEGSIEIQGQVNAEHWRKPAVTTVTEALTQTVFIPVVRCAGCRGDLGITLDIVAIDDASGVNSMMISNRADFLAAVWEPYGRTKQWRVPSDSNTTVYAKFRDNVGNVSRVVSDVYRVP